MTRTGIGTTGYLAIAIPEGPRVRGKVKLIPDTDAVPYLVHPGKRHRWHEMLHYGERGTGFAQCACGAVGVHYEPRVPGPTVQGTL